MNDEVARLAKLLSAAVKASCAEETGVVFSSGIDSSLIAHIAAEHCRVSAYCVGAKDSEDQKTVPLIEKDFSFPIKRIVIDEPMVEAMLPDLVRLCGTADPLKVSVGVPMYFAAKAAAEDGLKVVLSGQGGDELFGGYNRYLDHAAKEDYDGLRKAMEEDVSNAYKDNLDRDKAIFAAFGIELRFPYMDKAVSSYALQIPPGLKVHEVKDKADFSCIDDVQGKRFIRKYIMRLLAEEMGLPRLVIDRKKKAAQYGSGSEKLVQKLAKKKGFSGKDYARSYLESLRRA